MTSCRVLAKLAAAAVGLGELVDEDDAAEGGEARARHVQRREEVLEHDARQLDVAVRCLRGAAGRGEVGEHDEGRVHELYGQGDILFFTGRVGSDGDRDGLPNVIPEAMAAGLVVITSPSPS